MADEQNVVKASFNSRPALVLSIVAYNRTGVQNQFAGLFGKLLGNAYMDRILAYSDEKVVYNKEIALSERKTEVQSKVVTKTGDVLINYCLMLKSGRWVVYDVVIEGVSLVNNYRGQFNTILAKNSPQYLIDTVRKKTEQPKAPKGN